jgi:hypothetical protein
MQHLSTNFLMVLNQGHMKAFLAMEVSSIVYPFRYFVVAMALPSAEVVYKVVSSKA